MPDLSPPGDADAAYPTAGGVGALAKLLSSNLLGTLSGGVFFLMASWNLPIEEMGRYAVAISAQWIAVGLVGSGMVPLPVAVPMIMGANIGTTVTNSIAALAHMGSGDQFRRAFAAGRGLSQDCSTARRRRVRSPQQTQTHRFADLGHRRNPA